MSVLNRAALEESPLADLHELAIELSIDGFRRLRRDDLIAAILERQGAAPAADGAEPDDEERDTAARPRSRRGGRRRKPESAARAEEDTVEAPDADEEAEEPAPRRRRSRSRSRSRDADGEAGMAVGEDENDEEDDAVPRGDEETIEGVVELLPNGSGFVRVHPPEPSDDDVYVSAAQVKRCELVTGDRVSGPRRAPRRSERFASLVRVETVNGRPASELADAVRYEDLPAELPRQRLALGSEDPTLKAIEWLTPFGRGSRVTIAGASRAGKSEALRRLEAALREQEELQVSTVLAGVRPEEVSELTRSEHPPVAAVTLAGSPDAQSHAVELAVDQGRRIAARGGHAVVLIDTLDGLPPHVARRAMSAARAIVDGGSLTLIATAAQPLGGETTVIALDAALTSTGRFPALDLGRSGSVRPDLLVGEAAAEAIARARSEAVE